MNRGSRTLFHAGDESSFESAVEQVWNLCKFRIFAVGRVNHATASGDEGPDFLHELRERS